MITRIRTALKHDGGASAVEYALLVAGIAAVVIAAVFVLGSTVNGVFTKTNSCISAQGGTDC